MKEQKKTMRNLTWKLKEQPTAQEVADLVNAGVISNEEGREIIFGSPESDKDKIKTLEKQVELLTELVKSQTNRNATTYVPYYKEVTVPSVPWNNRIWMGTAKQLSGTGFSLTPSYGGGGTVTYTLGTNGGTNNELTS